MNLPPELQNQLATVLVVLLVTILTLFFRRIAPYFARRIIHLIWRLVNAVRRQDTARDEAIVAAITPPLRLLITIIGLQVILLIVQLPPALHTAETQLVASLTAVAIFWTFYRLTDVVANSLERAKSLAMLDHTVMRFGRQLGRAIIILVVFIIVLSQWGFDLAGLVAGLGIGGLAVALAAQDALANLIGYFVIITDSPFKVNHYIQIDDVEGFIEDITFRSTRLRKRDRSLVIIPNQTVVNSMITNWSRLKRRQIKIVLGVTYDTTDDQMRAIIADIHAMLDVHEQVAKTGKMVEFVEFGASSLDIMILCLAETVIWEDMQAIKADINLKLMRLLKQHGLSVAFPTTTLNFDSTAFGVFRPEAVSALPESDGNE